MVTKTWTMKFNSANVHTVPCCELHACIALTMCCELWAVRSKINVVSFLEYQLRLTLLVAQIFLIYTLIRIIIFAFNFFVPHCRSYKKRNKVHQYCLLYYFYFFFSFQTVMIMRHFWKVGLTYIWLPKKTS